MIWLEWTSNCWANSTSVFSPLIAANASFALKSRAVVPANSFRHIRSCSRQSCRVQAENPLMPAEQISRASSPERRRRRTPSEKLAIVAEKHEPGVTVSLVARRHGVASNQLFGWPPRRQRRQRANSRDWDREYGRAKTRVSLAHWCLFALGQSRAGSYSFPSARSFGNTATWRSQAW